MPLQLPFCSPTQSPINPRLPSLPTFFTSADLLLKKKRKKKEWFPLCWWLFHCATENATTLKPAWGLPAVFLQSHTLTHTHTDFSSRYTNTSPSTTCPGQGSDRIIPGNERREAVQFAVFWASQPDSVKKQLSLKHRRLHRELFPPNLSHGRLVSPPSSFHPLPLHSSANPIISLLLVLFLSIPPLLFLPSLASFSPLLTICSPLYLLCLASMFFQANWPSFFFKTIFPPFFPLFYPLHFVAAPIRRGFCFTQQKYTVKLQKLKYWDELLT